MAGLGEAMLAGRDADRVTREALQKASLIVVQAQGELSGLEATLGVALGHNAEVVTNSVEIDASVRVDSVRDIDVRVDGRIEQRKNQLRLAQMLGAGP